MKRPSVLILCLAFLLRPAPFFGPGAEPGGARAQGNPNGRSVTVAYFYKVKWGYQDEFLELFRRNHYPVLEAQVKGGRLLRVEAYTPRFHGDGRSDPQPEEDGSGHCNDCYRLSARRRTRAPRTGSATRLNKMLAQK